MFVDCCLLVGVCSRSLRVADCVDVVRYALLLYTVCNCVLCVVYWRLFFFFFLLLFAVCWLVSGVLCVGCCLSLLFV